MIEFFKEYSGIILLISLIIILSIFISTRKIDEDSYLPRKKITKPKIKEETEKLKIKIKQTPMYDETAGRIKTKEKNK